MGRCLLRVASSSFNTFWAKRDSTIELPDNAWGCTGEAN